MSETTHRHQLPYVVAAQSQKHVTVNEAFRALDALVQPSVRSAVVTDEPAGPIAGEGYVLPEGASGAAWDGFAAGTLAVFQDGAWAGFAPVTGLTAFVEDEGAHRVWNGEGWVALAANGGSSAPQTSAPQTSAPQTSAPRFGVNAEASDANRLTVASDAVLHTHDGSDARHVLNKAGAADTASFVFQTGYSGRAEIGLTGGDDFAFKVSADGRTFREAIVIDRTDGSVRFPNTQGARAGEGGDAPPAAGAGTSAAEVAATAEAFANGLRASLTASGGVAGGNLALTRQVVLASAAGKVQLASADDANLIETYASGAALAAGSVTHRRFMARGEVAVLRGLPAGAIVTSSRGVAGLSETAFGPFPLALEGFAAKRFFLFAFRASADGQGEVIVAAGAVPATARLLSGDGERLVGEVALGPFEVAGLGTDADAEFQLVADQPVFAGIASANGSADLRLLPPPAPELIGWTQQGRVSALYPDTTVRWHTQGGASGTFAVSPGAPVRLSDAGVPQRGGYAPDGCVVLRADGPISALSGADFGGSDATAFYPLSALGQRAPLPLPVAADPGSAASNSITLASPHAGQARLFAQDGTLVETLDLVRSQGATVPDDQLHPCAAQVAPAGFAGGYVEADVPIYVVQNAQDPGGLIPDGATGASKETVMPTVTPDTVRAKIRQDAAGLLRRWSLDASGQVSWPLC